MNQNVGTLDRVIRVVSGILLLLAAALVKDPLGWLGMSGFLPLLTGLFGECPLYTLFGVSTRASPEAESSSEPWPDTVTRSSACGRQS